MKILLCNAFILFQLITVYGQSNTADIKRIRVQYQEIQKNISSYDTVFIPLIGESTEGEQAIGYYKGSTLKLIVTEYLGETGKNRTEYYFDNDQLFFVLDQSFKYNRPIFWDQKRAEENDDTEIFDPSKTTLSEDRYYFKNKALILWLDNQKKEVDLKAGTNSLVGKHLIAHSQKIKEKLKSVH